MAKLLLTLIVLAAVWYGFKYMTRMAELQDRQRRRQAGGMRPESSPGRPAGQVEDLAQCPVCKTWQTGGAAKACGRADCPY